ncbi:MAG: metal-dependent hydrolase [Gammaproteobacteria bacterium]
MDPLSQGVFGAALPQSVSKPKNILFAGVLGFLSGMTPDLDVFIHSENDPLLFLEYHRQFTHSLVFITIGGLVCAVLFYVLFARFKLNFKQTYLFCTLGYATHGLLDSCTSYGTQLFWPFTSYRVSWDTISIIDPLFTLPITIFVIWAAIKKQPKIALIGLLWAITYQGIGLTQNYRAMKVGWQLAEQRYHKPMRLNAKPTLGNLLLWKVLYETEDHFFTDGIRMGIKTKIYPGTSIAKLNTHRDFPWLDLNSQQAKDLKRFAWFSQDYVAVDPDNPNRIFDVRYSLIPTETKGLWSIWLNPNADFTAHAEYKHEPSTNREKRELFYEMLKGL